MLLVAKPYHQSLNDIGISGWRDTQLGGLTTHSPIVDRLAIAPENTNGFSAVRGSADYDSLKIYIKMEGELADLSGTAISN